MTNRKAKAATLPDERSRDVRSGGRKGGAYLPVGRLHKARQNLPPFPINTIGTPAAAGKLQAAKAPTPEKAKAKAAGLKARRYTGKGAVRKGGDDPLLRAV